MTRIKNVLTENYFNTSLLSIHTESVKADLHGAILSHATSLQHAYDTKKVVGFENMF